MGVLEIAVTNEGIICASVSSGLQAPGPAPLSCLRKPANVNINSGWRYKGRLWSSSNRGCLSPCDNMWAVPHDFEAMHGIAAKP